VRTERAHLALYAICLFWCGVLVGVSFIATPAKFLVAELEIVTAIKVGRATFGIYHYFELAIALITCVVLGLYRADKITWAYFGLLAMLLAIQYLYIQPFVEASSNNLFAGIERQSKSSAHLYYIFCDCLKVTLLLSFLPAISFINKKRD